MQKDSSPQTYKTPEALLQMLHEISAMEDPILVPTVDTPSSDELTSIYRDSGLTVDATPLFIGGLASSERTTCDPEEIRRDGTPLSRAVGSILNNPNIHYLLIGEYHVDVSSPILRRDIASSLESAQTAGVTHVGLEINRDKQGILDAFSADTDDEELRLQIEQLFKYQPGGSHIVLEAARRGLRLVALDSSRPDDDLHDAPKQNQRDATMAEIVQDITDKQPEAKVLIWIGNSHVHKQSVASTNNGRITRLGARLPADQVASIRFVLPESRFDDLLSFMEGSQKDIVYAPAMSAGSQKVYVLPDEGKFKGDPRVSSTDYVACVA